MNIKRLEENKININSNDICVVIRLSLNFIFFYLSVFIVYR